MQTKLSLHPIDKCTSMNYLVFTLFIMMMAGTVKSAAAQKQEFKKLVAEKKVRHSKKRIIHTGNRPVPKISISNPHAMKEV